MPDPKFIQLPFGPGLDKETGLLVVKPNTMQDLRNVYHHEGSLAVRSGTEKTNEFFDGTGVAPDTIGTGDPATHILAGIAIRSERAGIVVSWESTQQRVAIWRVNALGEESTFVGFWHFRSTYLGEAVVTEWPVTDPPKIVLAEMYGQVFFAHDTYYDYERADTYVYNPWGLVTNERRLAPLSMTFEGAPSGFPSVVRFRGVVRHLHYLFGWGYGTYQETRPELVRVSLPGQPTVFSEYHYFIAGDRRDPVVACEPARQTLLVGKETETYQIIGYSRANFGIRPYDQLYGCLASRLITSVAGTVYVWSAEGPMAGGDVGPFEKLWLPLDLGGFEPASLVERTAFTEGWADYIDEVETIVYTFGRRVYALSLRNPADPRWAYWELGKKAFCGFRLYGGEDSIGGTPIGEPEIASISYEVEGCAANASQYIVTVTHDQQLPTDLIEVWHQPTGPFWEDSILDDPLNVDTDGDNIPDGWTYAGQIGNNALPSAFFRQGWFYLALRNFLNGTTLATDYVELYWTTGAVVVGDRYRFEVEARTPGIDSNAFSAGPIKLRVQFYDVGDSPVGAAQQVTIRHPAAAKAYVTATAVATATYARASLLVDIPQAGEQGEVYFRNATWQEEDTAAGDWVPAAPPVLVNVETTQELAPIWVDEPGMDYNVAIRYINTGLQSAPGYEDTSDPTTWPAASQGIALTELDAPDWYGVAPDYQAGFLRDDAVNGKWFQIFPGCDADGDSTGQNPPKYRNRDIQVYEDDVSIGKISRGDLYWSRRLLPSELNVEYQYKMRYLGPDRNSGFGTVLNLYAGLSSCAPTITRLEGVSFGIWVNGRYFIEIGRCTETWGDGQSVGVIIQDNYDGQGGLLAADEWNTVWVSQLVVFLGATQEVLFPPDNLIEHGARAKGLLLKVRAQEFFEPFPVWNTNPNETFEPTETGPWSEVREVQL